MQTAGVTEDHIGCSESLHVLLYLVGKHSPGTMNVVELGPGVEWSVHRPLGRLSGLPKLMKNRINTKRATRDVSDMLSKELPRIRSSKVIMVNPPICIDLRPIRSTSRMAQIEPGIAPATTSTRFPTAPFRRMLNSLVGSLLFNEPKPILCRKMVLFKASASAL